MFKSTWEKTSIISPLPEGAVEKMVHLIYPNKKLLSHDMIAGGCVNLNIKIQLESESLPLLLRVYLRDKEAAHRERSLSQLLKKTLPMPMTYNINAWEGYHFAITEYMPGMPLRDFLLSTDASYNLREIMEEVGVILSKIAAYSFPEIGFFDKDLGVTPYESSDILRYTHDCLSHKTVLSVLNSEVLSDIDRVISQSAHLLPDETEAHLVHGDFDPANILVHQVEGTWRVSAILDWEFAFSGSVLWDVANMLRYSHKMPSEFQDSFIDALEKNGITLPNHWRSTICLLNLSALLDCLVRSDPQEHLNQCADIKALIKHILSHFTLSGEQPEGG